MYLQQHVTEADCPLIIEQYNVSVDPHLILTINCSYRKKRGGGLPLMFDSLFHCTHSSQLFVIKIKKSGILIKLSCPHYQQNGKQYM